MAAAIGHKALAFIRPPIFDDVFTEEITDLQKIWSNKQKSFSNERARRFFDTYAGQPVLDAAMQSVAKLKGKDRQFPGQQVIAACDGYISSASADLLGGCMIELLNKLSPPNSILSWLSIMASPYLILFFGAQNWMEKKAPNGYWELGFTWLLLAIISMLVTALVSPLAASISAVVSAIRRRAVPVEYRQHGRNWEPFGRFARYAVLMASLGAGLGILSHHDKLQRWHNAPMEKIEETLNLNRITEYAHAAAWLKKYGFFISTREIRVAASSTEDLISDVQYNLKRLGYAVAVTGEMDRPTRLAMAEYSKKRNLKATDPQSILRSLCADLHGSCITTSLFR